MRHDAYGLPIATESTPALQSYDRAVDGLLAWDNQALDPFRAATTQDPGLALGHAGAAVCLFLEERFDEAIATAKVARTAAAVQTDRDRRHVEARSLRGGRSLRRRTGRSPARAASTLIHISPKIHTAKIARCGAARWLRPLVN